MGRLNFEKFVSSFLMVFLPFEIVRFVRSVIGFLIIQELIKVLAGPSLFMSCIIFRSFLLLNCEINSLQQLCLHSKEYRISEFHGSRGLRRSVNEVTSC